MLRTIVCAFVALAVFANAGLAQDAAKKKKGGNTGTITAVDADKGTITVEVKVKKATEKKTFKITEKTAVTALEGKKNKIDLRADKVSDLLKKEQFKVGATVTVEPSEDSPGVAKAVTFNAKKKKVKQ